MTFHLAGQRTQTTEFRDLVTLFCFPLLKLIWLQLHHNIAHVLLKLENLGIEIHW